MKKYSSNISLVDRLDVVGCSNISPDQAEKYWQEHKNHMTWGIQEALNQSWHPKDIAVLGAGRCNDINLLEIMQRGSVETIDLYDLDAAGLDEALHYTRAKINKLLPEALSYARFNPIIGDVTFVLEDMLNRFDNLYNELIHRKIKKESFDDQAMIVNRMIEEINKSLNNRPKPEKRYDVVVSDCILSQIAATLELQITQFFEALFNESDIAYELWEKIKHVIDKLFVEDHLRVLMEMVKPRGSIFIASDTTLLLRGKVSKQYGEESGRDSFNGKIVNTDEDYMLQEMEVSRFYYANGNLRTMVEKHLPNCTVIGEKRWEWNRNPYQLQNNDTVFSAEKVQGLVIKNTCRE